MTTQTPGGAVLAQPPEKNTARRPVRARRDPRGLLTRGGFLLPAVALVAVLSIVPFVLTVYRSFQDDRFVHPRFAGFADYHRMFSDPVVLKSLLNTVMWLGGTIILPVGLGLTVAVMTSQLSWGRYARLAVVLPYALSGSAVAVVWNFLLQNNGALNNALDFLHLGALSHGWLLSWPLNTLALIVANAWQATGVAVILYLVGLQSIPPETIEAAALDGATGWRRFRYIVFPQLRGVTIVVVGISLANGLKAFDLIWVLTGGGPGRSTETLAVSMYWESFVLQRPGSGAAVAVVLTIVVMAASWSYLRGQLRSTEGRAAR